MSNGKGKEMKTKLYLDTSVPSAFFDTSKPMRQLLTQKWFEFEANEYELCTSVISIEEIDRLSNAGKRKNIQDLLIKNERYHTPGQALDPEPPQAVLFRPKGRGILPCDLSTRSEIDHHDSLLLSLV